MGRSQIYKKRRPTLRSLSRKVEALEDEVELKEFAQWTYSISPSLPASTTISATAPKVFLINCPSPGNAYNQRVGDDIQMTSFHVTGRLLPTTSTQFQNTTGWDQKFRLLIVCDKEPSREGPTIWGPSPSGVGDKPALFDVGVGTPHMYTQYNTKDRCYDQYDVLYDQIVGHKVTNNLWNPTTGVINTTLPIVYFDIKEKFRRKVSFEPSGGAGTIASMVKNSLYFVIIPNFQAANINWQVEMDTKIFYKDP